MARWPGIAAVLVFLMILPGSVAFASPAAPSSGRSHIAKGDRTPKASESRAAYCKGVVQEQRKSSLGLTFLEQDRNSIADREYEKDRLRDHARRIDAYLQPRLRLIDNQSIFLAIEQGRRDVDALRRADVFGFCRGQCGGTPVEDRAACTGDCLSRDYRYAAVRRCETLDFLPY